MSRETSPIISAQKVCKEYSGVEVLHDIDLDISAGELTLITGPSGSGKTTLLNIIAGIDRPTSGRVIYGEEDLSAKTDKQLTAWRAHKTGNVFQRSGLLGGLTAKANILSPHYLTEKQLDRQWAGEVCSRLAITSLLDTPAYRLSGGERQRVAIARALLHKPEIVFADEPSASLDTENKQTVHRVLRELVTNMGVTLVMVSHDELSASYADTVVNMQDGRLKPTPRPTLPQHQTFTTVPLPPAY